MSTAIPAPLATGGDTYAATEAAKQAYAGHEIAADSEYSLLVRLTSDSAQQELTKHQPGSRTRVLRGNAACDLSPSAPMARGPKEVRMQAHSPIIPDCTLFLGEEEKAQSGMIGE